MCGDAENTIKEVVGNTIDNVVFRKPCCGLVTLGCLAGAISLPIFLCKYYDATLCDEQILVMIIGGGGFGGALSALTSILMLAALIASVRILYSSLIYIVRNIPYTINRCTYGLSNVANYAINKLANCYSRLVRLAGLSGRDEQETDVESNNIEELSEITTSSSQKSEYSGDADQTEQGQSQLSRRPSFASLMNPFSIFYRSEQAVSEALPQERRPSFTSLMNPFSFFRVFNNEADLEDGATASVESRTDISEGMSLTTENGV